MHAEAESSPVGLTYLTRPDQSTWTARKADQGPGAIRCGEMMPMPA